ncbi:MAG: hypothetical protein C0471_08000 [Erythrobacter sp.]|nr:hypothetical protein [Erythrobacter sp.]
MKYLEVPAPFYGLSVAVFAKMAASSPIEHNLLVVAIEEEERRSSLRRYATTGFMSVNLYEYY